MLRLPSQQPLKTLRSPYVILCKALSSCAKFTAAKVITSQSHSPDRLARRFSSAPKPKLYYQLQKELDARDRGEWVDIHDTGMNENTLRTNIGKVTRLEILQEATKEEAKKSSNRQWVFLWPHAPHGISIRCPLQR
jgi:hypothetical protein